LIRQIIKLISIYSPPKPQPSTIEWVLKRELLPQRLTPRCSFGCRSIPAPAWLLLRCAHATSGTQGRSRSRERLHRRTPRTGSRAHAEPARQHPRDCPCRERAHHLRTWYLHGNLLHLGAYRHHIGIYPGPAAIEALANAITPLKTSKGTILLPHDAPLPLELVERLIRWRLERARSGASGTGLERLP
jgi:hypothetical protein